jgi:short-subunit dehydrogenase
MSSSENKSSILKGKVVVITGASSGVGLAAAEAFANEGCHLVLAARGEKALEAAAERCLQLGAVAMAIPTDMSVASEVKELAEKALAFNGKIDVWVNNAGVMATGKFEEMPFDTIDQVVKTNLLGYMHGARCVLPIFRKQNYGVLINNISIGGWMPAPYGAAYSASKYGIRGLVETLQGEVSDAKHIHVCALYPSIQRSTGNMHSAKYNGLDFKVPPMAADPRELASAMVNMAKNPRKSEFTDWTSAIFKFLYSVFPKTIVNTNSAALRFMMKDDATTDTSGNVLSPSHKPMRVYGETMLPVPSRTTKALVVAGIGVLGAYWLLTSKKK